MRARASNEDLTTRSVLGDANLMSDRVEHTIMPGGSDAMRVGQTFKFAFLLAAVIACAACGPDIDFKMCPNNGAAGLFGPPSCACPTLGQITSGEAEATSCSDTTLTCYSDSITGPSCYCSDRDKTWHCDPLPSHDMAVPIDLATAD